MGAGLWVLEPRGIRARDQTLTAGRCKKVKPRVCHLSIRFPRGGQQAGWRGLVTCPLKLDRIEVEDFASGNPVSGQAKADGLLDEEAIRLQLVAGARNYLSANRPLEFRFEVTA